MARPITHEGPLVVAGFGDVGQNLAAILKDAGEDVCIIDAAERPGVDVVGDVLDPDILERGSVADARVVILALDSDSATLFAAGSATIARFAIRSGAICGGGVSTSNSLLLLLR